jgi:hypothetical protein
VDGVIVVAGFLGALLGAFGAIVAAYRWLDRLG